MKTPTTTPIVQMNAEELNKQRSESETLSTNKPMPQPTVKGKVFSASDLWRLRRQSRIQGLVIR